MSWFLVSVLLLGVLSAFHSRAEEAVIVRDIRLSGLVRIPRSQVLEALPLKVGDRLEPGKTEAIIRQLHRIGAFEQIRVARDGETLVILVEEHPRIDSLEFSGVKVATRGDFEEIVAAMDARTGRFLSPSRLNDIEAKVRELYARLGKYWPEVKFDVSHGERNSAAVVVQIDEGPTATIKEINILGNHIFEDRVLLQEFSLASMTPLSMRARLDIYSKKALAADLEKLRSYYLDRGYLNFNIDSAQVSISPDRFELYVTINITEGEPFRIGGVSLAGDFVGEESGLLALLGVETGQVVSRGAEGTDQVMRLLGAQTGQVFSRDEVIRTTSALNEYYGDRGYGFANVNAVPDIDESAKSVDLTFFVDPGRLVCVRKVTFTGELHTGESILRRVMRIKEGEWISTRAVERSKKEWEALGYSVDVETPAVPGTRDHIDVDVNLQSKFERSESSLPGTPEWIRRKSNLCEGNAVTTAMLSRLEPGFSEAQVRFVLGQPRVEDPGKPSVWRYYFHPTDRRNTRTMEHVALEFADGKLLRIGSPEPVPR